MNKHKFSKKTITELKRLSSLPVVRALAALCFVVIIGLIFNADSSFFKWDTHRDMLRHISVFGILACGMTLVLDYYGRD